MRLIGFLIALVFASQVAAETIGRPQVIDGQTIKVKNIVFKLYGIMAPDLMQTCKVRGKKYPCGQISRSALMDLVAGVNVRCAMRPKSKAALCTAGGYDLSEGMVYTGWALAMPRKGTKYISFEREAEKTRRGLWRGKFTKPWAWRAGKK